jgi:hypothetical protein
LSFIKKLETKFKKNHLYATNKMLYQEEVVEELTVEDLIITSLKKKPSS